MPLGIEIPACGRDCGTGSLVQFRDMGMDKARSHYLSGFDDGQTGIGSPLKANKYRGQDYHGSHVFTCELHSILLHHSFAVNITSGALLGLMGVSPGGHERWLEGMKHRNTDLTVVSCIVVWRAVDECGDDLGDPGWSVS